MFHPQEGQALYAPPVAGPGPMAPPPSMFGNVPGYEDTVLGGGGYLPPPVPVNPIPMPEPTPVVDWNIPSISEDTARGAFKEFVGGHCCYSSGPANDGVITKMEEYNTYRYRLQTFTESRSTEWATKPHEGEVADFYTQTAPRPWEVQVQLPPFFKDHTEEIRVPFTSSIKDCHTCHSSGTLPCEECSGAGNKVCWVCSGSGTRLEEPCSRCDATGREKCSECNGTATKECDTCKGHRQLLAYIKLTVVWKDNIGDYVTPQSSGLGDECLSSVTGKELYKITQFMVYPVMGFPDPALSEASARLVREHQTEYPKESRILQQQQTIELIPITKVNYKWKGDTHKYYVYGNEHEVNADDYPATCCCTIM